MRRAEEGNAPYAFQEVCRLSLALRIPQRVAKNLLDHQAAEAVTDEDDVALRKARLCKKAGKDIVAPVRQIHSEPAPVRFGGRISDGPNSDTGQVLGQPFRPKNGRRPFSGPCFCDVTRQPVNKHHVSRHVVVIARDCE